MQIIVRNGNVGAAYKLLMKNLNKDGLFKELKKREGYIPPTKKKLLKHKLAVSRLKKEQRKRKENFDTMESRLAYRTGYKNQKSS